MLYDGFIYPHGMVFQYCTNLMYGLHRIVAEKIQHLYYLLQVCNYYYFLRFNYKLFLKTSCFWPVGGTSGIGALQLKLHYSFMVWNFYSKVSVTRHETPTLKLMLHCLMEKLIMDLWLLIEINQLTWQWQITVINNKLQLTIEITIYTMRIERFRAVIVFIWVNVFLRSSNRK